MLKYTIDVMNELEYRGYNNTFLQRNNLLGSGDVSKIKKGIVLGNIGINKLCKLLDMQPGDFLEYVPDQED